MRWDDNDEVYRCAHGCGEVDENPPDDTIAPPVCADTKEDAEPTADVISYYRTHKDQLSVSGLEELKHRISDELNRRRSQQRRQNGDGEGGL